MSLGKLLVAGKSVAGAHGALPYRKNKGVYLPKFGSPKNPFASPPKEQAAAAPPVERRASKVESQTALPSTPDPRPSTSKTPVLLSRPVRTPSWAEKLNPFRSSPSSPQTDAQAVQEELSLDSVKVVHNDLSDVDVDVVPMKSRPPAEEPSVMPAAEKLWGHLGKRVLKTS
jgi:hypothetical protein